MVRACGEGDGVLDPIILQIVVLLALIRHAKA